MESFVHVMQRLQEGLAVKLVLSCVVSVAAEEHAQLFAGFVLLVFADLFTKCLSLSRRCLLDGGVAAPSVWQACKGLRAAHRARYISSKEMRRGFVHKILSYIAVVLSAAALDFMLGHVQSPAFATGLVIGYLAMTEFVSIMENLQGAGVAEAGAFAALVRKRGGVSDGRGDESPVKGDGHGVRGDEACAMTGVSKNEEAADGCGDGGRADGGNDERKVR